MVENVTEMMHREWNLVNTDTNDYNNGLVSNHPHHSRKVSDNSSNQHHQSTNNYNDLSTTVAIRTLKPLSNQRSLDRVYDTDSALGTFGNRSKHHQHHTTSSSNNYEYLISPRLPPRRNGVQSSKQVASIPFQQRLPHKMHPTANGSTSTSHNHDDRDEEANYDDYLRRRNIRLTRRAHQTPTPPVGNHGTRNGRPPTLTQHIKPLAVVPSVQPLRIIFMRHSERANQALGPDWFNRAFRTNTYNRYDENLPAYLPKRRSVQSYEFDPPLTVRGLKAARLTGHAMLNNNLVADICFSSNALRCVQTCERILCGMERRDHVPIRIEPGLFECPHYNHKIVDNFMTKKELMQNQYSIKHEYRPIISKVTVPETLEDYFERSAMVMRGIIDRYAHYGRTILIVTHAPGLLALTNAIKGLKPKTETFYRDVSVFPPLATYMAEYDGSQWKYSEQAFNLVAT